MALNPLSSLGRIFGEAILTGIGKLKVVFVAFLALLLTAITPLLQILNGAITAFVANVPGVQYWLEVAEAWFPVCYFMTATATFIYFVSFFIVVKLVIKLIPFIG